MARTQASSVGRRFIAEQTIGTTVTWSGTPPTGETKLYNWSQDFSTRIVTVSIHLFYTGAGTTNTTATIPFPTDLPNPLVNTGLTGASVILYTGTGEITTGIGTQPGGLIQVSTIRRNAGDTGFNFVVFSSAGVAAKAAIINISYYY